MEMRTCILGATERPPLEDYADAPSASRRDAVLRGCPGLVRALTAFRQRVDDVPILLIRGLPQKHVGDLPTPDDRRNPESVDERTERVMALCAELLGLRLRAAAGEAFPFDTPFHHVIPQRGHLDTPAVNHGAGDFPFHQDRIFLDAQPEYHLLAGVRLGNDPCPTAFMDGRALLAGLLPEVEDALRRPDFEDPATGKRVPVLRTGADGPYLGVDLQPGWMRPICPEAEAALDHLRRRSAELAAPDVISVLIGPGDLLIHDHRRLLHGRERFRPDFSRPDDVRWMIRAHGVL